MQNARLKILKFLFVLFTGSIFTYCSTTDENPTPKVVTPETAMSAYLNNGDVTYQWTKESTYNLAGVTAATGFPLVERFGDLLIGETTICSPKV